MLAYFRIKELVHPDIYQARGERAWELLDPRALAVLDPLRARYGPVTINTWMWEGDRKYSGLRPFKAPYAKYSQHKYGRAFDCLFRGVTADEVRQDILTLDPFPEITAIEAGVSWLHFDVRNCERIKVFYP